MIVCNYNDCKNLTDERYNGYCVRHKKFRPCKRRNCNNRVALFDLCREHYLQQHYPELKSSEQI